MLSRLFLLIAVLGSAFIGCRQTNVQEGNLDAVADYCFIGYCGCYCNDGTAFSDKCTPFAGIDACKDHCQTVCAKNEGAADSCSARLKCDFQKECTCISGGTCNNKTSAASC